MKKLRLTEAEISAILSTADAEGLEWMDCGQCPGAIVASLEEQCFALCFTTPRGKAVSYATTPNPGESDKAHSAGEALAWMRRSRLVQSAAAARHEVHS